MRVEIFLTILFNSIKPDLGYSTKFCFLRVLNELIEDTSLGEAFLYVSINVSLLII